MAQSSIIRFSLIITPMTEFIPGLQLSEMFYTEAVRPILAAHFSRVPYAAALVGWGSEVLGFDTPMSRDHHWGPRLLLFLRDDDIQAVKHLISKALSRELPVTFHGYSTNFGPPDGIGVRLMKPVEQGPVDHMVHIESVSVLLRWYLGWDMQRSLSMEDWLTFPEHKLRAITGGKVFHDGVGELTAARQALAYYPQDLWYYLMASDWARISEEEPFVGRCGDVGDDLGSRVIAARLVQYVMHLCFLQEKAYAPYSKWFGTAFSRLACAAEFEPLFGPVFAAAGWEERQEAMARVYEAAAHRHNLLGITSPMQEHSGLFHNRPYKVIDADEVSGALMAEIKDEVVRRIPFQIGSVNQVSDSTVLLTRPVLLDRMKDLYKPV